MSGLDLQSFLQERLKQLDSTLDTSEGSDADVKIIQPILRRLGPDPFSVDIRAFLLDLLNQNFPDMPTSPQDAISEYLILPIELVLAVVTREINRLQLNKSLKNPELLNIEEAESLGSNFFRDRDPGTFAKGRGRLYFNQPTLATVTAANVFTTQGGLGYVPTETQSISADQMLYNLEGNLYYFDVNVIATQAGDQYSIGPSELVAVTGLPGVVRVTNKGRFTPAVAEETAEQYIEKVRSSLGAQSMVSTPGIVAETQKAFPNMTRQLVVGAEDPRMQRDIIRGASLSEIQRAGISGHATSDNEGRPTSRRFQIDTGVDTDVNFLQLQGPTSLVLTFHAPFVGPARARDVEVRRILSADTLELEESLLPPTAVDMPWTLRKKELKLSRIPGGILAPDGLGQTALPPNEVHIGGMFDTYVRDISLNTVSLTLDNIVDDAPALRGEHATGAASTVTLGDLVLGTSYQPHDDTYKLLETAAPLRFALQVVDGPGAGVYDILSVAQPPAGSPVLTLYGALLAPLSGNRWKLLDQINVELTDPKETLAEGTDLEVAQGVNQVTTTALTNFQELGVVAGHVLRIYSGPDADDYPIVQVLSAPAYSRLQIDRPLTTTQANLRYIVFRPNQAGSVPTPLVRITEMSILSATGEPTGGTVPYGATLGAYVTALTNPSRGVKLQVPSVLLGIISNPLPSGANVSGKVLQLNVQDVGIITTAFVGANPISLDSIIAQVNASAGFVLAGRVGDRLGIYPYNGFVEVVGDDSVLTTALTALFGGRFYISSRMVRSPDFSSTTFVGLSPALSLEYDVIDILSGGQISSRALGKVSPFPLSETIAVPSVGLLLANCIEVQGESFFPEFDVRAAIGASTLGTVRCYFLEPTTVEFNAQSRFREEGGLLYRPDPAYSATLLPAAPFGSKPNDGQAAGGTTELVSSVDFIRKRIRPGDVVEIDYVPILGGFALPDPIANLAFTTLRVSFGQEAERVITFVNDDDGIAGTDVTRAGAIDQINNALGAVAARLAPGNILELNPDFLLVVRLTGTANALLGLSDVADSDNRSANAGRYTITVPKTTGATLDRVLSVAEDQMQFKVLRPGAQRCGTTQMKAQPTDGGLYYFDVEVVSVGTGDLFNLGDGVYLEASGYQADGYTLTTNDSTLSFSSQEQIGLVLSRSVNGIGTNDDPEEATQLSGTTLQITGEGSDLVSEMQAYLLADEQRDVCANPLARCLTPHFVRFSITYTGGPKEDVLRPLLSTSVQSLQPDDALKTSVINATLTQQGATSVANPITIYAVVHGQDRKVWLERSQNEINVDGLAAFYPDVLGLTRLAR